jgi:hypothetical protein
MGGGGSSGGAAACAAPLCGTLEEYLSACASRSLALFLYEDARFLAERLVAASASEVRARRLSPLSSERRAAQPASLVGKGDARATWHSS